MIFELARIEIDPQDATARHLAAIVSVWIARSIIRAIICWS